MATSRIPRDVAAAIKKCWPDGVVEEFSTDESYFHDIQSRLERDLRKIHGASLLWQTEEAESGGWDEDANAEPPPTEEWQSYHVFFLAPHGDAFHFEDETEGMKEAEDADEDVGEEAWTETTYPGERWIGCAVGICLAARYAAINLGSYSRYADGTMMAPDVESFIYSDKTYERVDTNRYHRELLSQEAFQKLKALSDKIVSILAKHRVQVLDESVLNLRVPRLRAATEVFLEEPLRVRDAFFFRGA